MLQVPPRLADGRSWSDGSHMQILACCGGPCRWQRGRATLSASRSKGRSQASAAALQRVPCALATCCAALHAYTCWTKEEGAGSAVMEGCRTCVQDSNACLQHRVAHLRAAMYLGVLCWRLDSMFHSTQSSDPSHFNLNMKSMSRRHGQHAMWEAPCQKGQGGVVEPGKL